MVAVEQSLGKPHTGRPNCSPKTYSKYRIEELIVYIPIRSPIGNDANILNIYLPARLPITQSACAPQTQPQKGKQGQRFDRRLELWQVGECQQGPGKIVRWLNHFFSRGPRKSIFPFGSHSLTNVNHLPFSLSLLLLPSLEVFGLGSSLLRVFSDSNFLSSKMTETAAAAAPAADTTSRPTRPDEKVFEQELAKAEAAHKAAMNRFVCFVKQSIRPCTCASRQLLPCMGDIRDHC